MKRINALFLAIAGMCLFYGCLSDPELPDIINGSAPVIRIDTIMDVKANSLKIQASITQQGGSPVSEKGFSWTDGKGGTGSMQVTGKKDGSIIRLDTMITGLEKETTYTFTAYARNGIDEGVSDAKTEQTGNGLGLIRTFKPDSIRGTSAWAGGMILEKGEGEITERGIYFYKDRDMTEVDFKRPFPLQADSFFFKLDSLTPTTTYYIKAYATNAFGVFSQSNGETFRTISGKPSITLFQITGTGFVDATFTAEIGDEGDSAVTVRGVCWSETSTFPTIQDDTTVVSSGDNSFSGSMKGLKSYTTYYARAFATNAFGTEYSDNVAEFTTENNMPVIETGEVQFIKDGTVMIRGVIRKIGMGSIDVFGFCYSTSPNPTISNKTTVIPNEGQIESPFSSSIVGLRGNTTYYVKAYLRNTSSLIAYGEEIIVHTDPIFIQMAPFTGDVLVANSSASFSIDPVGYIVGGDLGAKYTNELMAYNSIDDRWDKLEPMPGGADSERTGQAAVAVNRVAYVLGGINKANKRTNSLYRYYPNYNRWENITSPSGPDSLRSAIGCSIGYDAYYIGGCRDTVMDEVWNLNTSGLSWTRMGDFPVKQYSGIAVTIDDVVYAGLGLTNLSGTVSHKRLWKSTDNLNSWTELAPLSVGGIARGAVVYNNAIYVVDNAANLWMYNIEENTWYEKSRLPVTHFRGDVQHCMFLLNEKIYIGLGSSKKTLYQYNPAWDN
ncbi:MAG: hypothetical protein LBK45_01720 [Tannerellaceae bacterium]|nr:hypothetical protein [Tannerellaceae bacterium]